MRIRTKLSLFAFLLAFIPTATVGLLGLVSFTGFSRDSFEATHAALEADAMRALQDGATRDADLMRTLMGGVQSNLLSLASSDDAAAYLACRAGDAAQIRSALRPIELSVLAQAREVRGQVDALSHALDRNLAIGMHLLKELGAPRLADTREDVQVIDQDSKAVGTVSLRPFLLGDDGLSRSDDPEQVVAVVDAPAQLVGGLFTLFQRLDDGSLLRLATNVRTAEGRRAVGTCIPAKRPDGSPNPVVAAISAGKPFHGASKVVDGICITSYLPIADAGGKVIGAFFSGIPVSEAPQLVTAVVERGLDLKGYGFGLDGQGRFFAHPRREWLRKEVLGDLHLDSLRPLVEDRSADGVARQLFYQIDGVAKAMVYTRLPELDWTIGYACTLDELMQAVGERQRAQFIRQAEVYASSCMEAPTPDGGTRSLRLFNQIRLLDAKGREVVSFQQGKPVTALKDCSGRQWCQEALRCPPGGIYWSPIEVAVNTGLPELRLVRPMHASDGSLRGLMTVSVNWQAINAVVVAHRYGLSGRPWMVNRDGRYIIHPSIAVTEVTRTSDAKAGGQAQASITDAAEGSDLPGLAPRILSGQAGSGTYRLGGIEHLVAWTPVILGERRCAIAAAAPASELMAVAEAARLRSHAASRSILWRQMLLGGLVIVVAMAAGLVFSRRLMRPVAGTEAALRMLAEGDLRPRMDATSADEFGHMAQALNQALAAMGETAQAIGGHSRSLAGRAQDLDGLSVSLGGSAGTSASDAELAAGSAGQVAASVASVATAVEELGASTKEISRNAQEAAMAAKHGVATAASAQATMSGLQQSATEIGGIVKLITGIAEQVNLLALNATIEAARAGDAGRGFTVVASEVKELARRTQAASADIGRRILAIRSGAEEGAAAIGRVADEIRRIDELQQTVAAAVEEQAATTEEMGRSVQAAASGTQGIAGSVAAVAGSTATTRQAVDQVRAAATELNRLSEQLQQSVARFKT